MLKNVFVIIYNTLPVTWWENIFLFLWSVEEWKMVYVTTIDAVKIDNL